MRQDRAAFRFRTSGPTVTVELPPGTSADQLEVLVDGQPAEIASRAAGRLVVRVATALGEHTASVENANAPHTLELRYRRANQWALLVRRHLTPPQLDGMTALAEVYWQIVLPSDGHVIQAPPQLAAASQWQWLGNFWGRRPTRSQADLEKWSGASSQLAPSAAQNEYLYCGLSPLSSIEVVTAPRWLIVLTASGAVLALVLAWIYVPAVRRGWLVLVLACALAVMAAAFPTPALLLGQASVLGIVLSALAVWIARFTTRSTRWVPPVATGSTHRQLTPRSDSLLIPSVATAASTAPAAPFQLPDSQR